MCVSAGNNEGGEDLQGGETMRSLEMMNEMKWEMMREERINKGVK